MLDKRLPEGKLPIDVLEPMLESITTGNLIVGPSIGVDVGVAKIRGKYIVSSSDPITGAVKRMGWYAVNVSANDIATSGIMPKNLSVVGLFTRGTRIGEITAVMEEINETARDLGITVAGGHTEITPGLRKPILIVTCFGSGNKFVTSAQASSGDSIIMTKTAGIEGTSILAGLSIIRRSLSKSDYKLSLRLIERLSILQEARIAFGTERIHAMHDVTEGGVIGAVAEMSLASGLGFELAVDSVPVDSSTKKICDLLSIDPLKLIGSGALLIACSVKSESMVKNALLRKGIQCSTIGMFLRNRKERKLITHDGNQVKSLRLSGRSVQDEIWPALEKYGAN